MMVYQVLQSGADWYNQHLTDGGPVYAETNPDHFIVEPWNAVSSLFIVIPAVYWLFRITGLAKDFKFLLYCIPLMILGGAGSTLFHAFRISPFFLFMDILPTALLTFSLMIYFWLKVFKHWWYIIFVIGISIGVRFLFFGNIPDFMAINISYVITGVLIGLPLLIILFQTKYYKIKDVLLAILFFCLAIVFREMDSRDVPFFPMGTHFLWHGFTGIGAYFILSYLYAFRKREIKNS
jgi:hemolysin III